MQQGKIAAKIDDAAKSLSELQCQFSKNAMAFESAGQCHNSYRLEHAHLCVLDLFIVPRGRRQGRMRCQTL